MKKFILLLLFCLMSKSAISQENRDYFPMEVGNKWYYVHSDPWMDKYGSIDSSLSIIGTESINDTLYFKFDESDFLSKHIRVWTNLLRKDSIGNIFGRIFGKDQLLFRAKYVPNDVWWVMDADSLKIIKIIAYTSATHDFPPMMLPFMHLFDTCFSTYETKCAPLYISFRMWHWDDVTLTMTNNFGITSTGSNMYEQFRLIRFKTKDSIVTPRTFLFKDWGIKKNKFGFIITDLFDSNAVNYISLESGKSGKLTPRLIFEPGEDPYFFTEGKYFVESREGYIPDDTITVIFSGDMRDVMGNKLDGNQNGIPEGSPTDDFKVMYVTRKIVSVKEERDELSFKVFPNYPNPFNPTTKISYSLNTSGFVTLKIHDILGRELVILVNEHKKPGIYEATFNANSTNKILSSGVYFYKLQVNNFTECRKMVFAK